MKKPLHVKRDQSIKNTETNGANEVKIPPKEGNGDNISNQKGHGLGRNSRFW